MWEINFCMYSYDKLFMCSLEHSLVFISMVLTVFLEERFQQLAVFYTWCLLYISVAILQIRVQLSQIVETSQHMCGALSHCLNLLAQQEEVRHIYLIGHVSHCVCHYWHYYRTGALALHTCQVSQNFCENPEKHGDFTYKFMFNFQVSRNTFAPTWQHWL